MNWLNMFDGREVEAYKVLKEEFLDKKIERRSSVMFPIWWV